MSFRHGQSWLLIGVAAIAGCAAGARSRPVTRTATADNSPHVWVDFSGPEAGDGSAEHPYRTLQAALEHGARTLEVRSGVYRGPFRLPEGTAINGHGEVVLALEGTGVVVETQGRVRLGQLAIQGGGIGLSASGATTLEGLEFSGQSNVALVQRQGTLEAHHLALEGTISETVGLRLDAGAQAVIADVNFTGAFRRAVDVEANAKLAMRRWRSQGPVTAVHAVNAAVVLEDGVSTEGRGPGVFLGDTRARLSHLVLIGHEYGVLARAGLLCARHVTVGRAERAGIGLTQSDAELIDLDVVDAGASGAVQVLGGTTRLRRFLAAASRGFGINAVQGRMAVSDAVVAQIRDEDQASGEALSFRRAEAFVTHVEVATVGGAGILAAEGAHVRATDLHVDHSVTGGLVAETSGRIESADLYVTNSGAAVAVPGDGRVELSHGVSVRNEHGPVWAECQQGAEVRLGQLVGQPVEAAACIARGRAPIKVDSPADAWGIGACQQLSSP